MKKYILTALFLTLSTNSHAWYAGYYCGTEDINLDVIMIYASEKNAKFADIGMRDYMELGVKAMADQFKKKCSNVENIRYGLGGNAEGFVAYQAFRGAKKNERYDYMAFAPTMEEVLIKAKKFNNTSFKITSQSELKIIPVHYVPPFEFTAQGLKNYLSGVTSYKSSEKLMGLLKDKVEINNRELLRSPDVQKIHEFIINMISQNKSDEMLLKKAVMGSLFIQKLEILSWYATALAELMKERYEIAKDIIAENSVLSSDAQVQEILENANALFRDLDRITLLNDDELKEVVVYLLEDEEKVEELLEKKKYLLKDVFSVLNLEYLLNYSF